VSLLPSSLLFSLLSLVYTHLKVARGRMNDNRESLGEIGHFSRNVNGHKKSDDRNKTHRSDSEERDCQNNRETEIEIEVEIEIAIEEDREGN
jgi:hypothetical protein